MENQMKMDVILEKKVVELLRAGKLVEAVAAVQNQMKIGLKNSKDLVDSLAESLVEEKNTAASATKRNL